MHTQNAQATASFPVMPKSGYTAIEIVVTVSVFTILVGSVVTGLYSARRSGTVRKASDQFAAHLREAALLTQSGVYADGCPLLPSPATACTRYHVTFTAGGNMYTRETGRGTNPVQFRLPPGAVFGGAGDVRFIYDPPLLKTEAGTAQYRIQDASSATIFSDVCVTSLGTVSVGGC